MAALYLVHLDCAGDGNAIGVLVAKHHLVEGAGGEADVLKDPLLQR